jgi:hypothetical protein
VAEAEPTRAPGAVLAAAGVVAAEGVALLGLAGVDVLLTMVADAASVPLALSTALLIAVFGAVLLLLARALRAQKPAARSPVVAFQLLALPVGWTLAVGNSRPEYGVPVLLFAVAVLVLLFGTAEARDALERPRPVED